MLNHSLKLNTKIFNDDPVTGKITNVEKISTRQGFGEGLLQAGSLNENIIALSADLAESTKLNLFAEKFPESKNFKKAFINAQIYKEEGEEYSFNEGCLSFPGLREDIMRKPVIYLKYMDENFIEHDERFDGVIARVIQHEYDHIEGVVFVDRIPTLKKMLLKRRLSDISKGNVEVSYRMLFSLVKKGRR